MSARNAITIQQPPAGDDLICHEHRFHSRDDTELFYRAWHPGRPRDKAVILFHGGHEHSGRFQALVEALDLRDVSVFAWDARGHGRSPGARGDARHFHDLVRDADCFVTHIRDAHGIAIEDMVVLGHSVGSVIIAAWLLDHARPVRGAVLGSPAFRVKLYIPFALSALRLWQRIRPEGVVNSYVKPEMLTHDAEEARQRREDPLISPRIAIRVLTSLFDTAERVIEHAGSITAPVLLLSAGQDRVVHRRAQRRFFQRLGSSDKTWEGLPGLYHEIFHERNRSRPIASAKGFIEHCFATEATRSIEPASDKVSERDHHELTQALPWTDPRRYYFGAIRLALQTVGRLSQGIRLGWQTGFDSGRTLDYVYENRARGTTPIGRLIDRAYLDAVGWRGIRQRGANLRALLIRTITALRRGGRPVHVADVAAGPGRYLIEALRDLGDPGVSVTCRDRDEPGLAQGRRRAEALGVANIHFEPGDAFDPASLARLTPAPDIVVVSGLYELFSDNALIARSLSGIRSAMGTNGYLIYTNQPNHPQLELIARTLINRDHEPWVMRLRSQAEMNRLVRGAGFEPIETVLDDAGIFSVTVARKRNA
jgi:alpha-beta hydrolase superfamily lysophospholipase/SAM-dependent methyltransferase